MTIFSYHSCIQGKGNAVDTSNKIRENEKKRNFAPSIKLKIDNLKQERSCTQLVHINGIAI